VCLCSSSGKLETAAVVMEAAQQGLVGGLASLPLACLVFCSGLLAYLDCCCTAALIYDVQLRMNVL